MTGLVVLALICVTGYAAAELLYFRRPHRTDHRPDPQWVAFDAAMSKHAKPPKEPHP